MENKLKNICCTIPGDRFRHLMSPFAWISFGFGSRGRFFGRVWRILCADDDSEPITYCLPAICSMKIRCNRCVSTENIIRFWYTYYIVGLERRCNRRNGIKCVPQNQIVERKPLLARLLGGCVGGCVGGWVYLANVKCTLTYVYTHIQGHRSVYSMMAVLPPLNFLRFHTHSLPDLHVRCWMQAPYGTIWTWSRSPYNKAKAHDIQQLSRQGMMHAVNCSNTVWSCMLVGGVQGHFAGLARCSKRLANLSPCQTNAVNFNTLQVYVDVFNL